MNVGTLCLRHSVTIWASPPSDGSGENGDCHGLLDFPPAVLAAIEATWARMEGIIAATIAFLRVALLASAVTRCGIRIFASCEPLIDNFRLTLEKSWFMVLDIFFLYQVRSEEHT